MFVRLLPPLILFSACSGIPRDVTDASGDIGDVVEGTNAFTFAMYREVVEDLDTNVFISPFSLSAALSMTMAGSSGTTRTEMQEVLGASDPDAWHPAFGALVRDLDGIDKNRDYTLQIANRLFGLPDVPWSPTFLEICADDYGAPLEPTDFASDPEAGRSRVNDWVADQTSNRIRDLLPAGSVDTSTRLVLANAIDFEAQWATPFDAAKTFDGDFTRLDGSTVTTPIMSIDTKELREARLAAGLFDGGLVVRLPYGDKEELSMLLVVPASPDGLPDLEQSLTAERFDDWVGALDSSFTDIALRMPKFEMTFEVDGMPLLAELGIPSIFSADLAAMTDPPGNGLGISGVYHKAFVSVDETGTRASAASAVAVNESGPLLVEATHPFLFAIRDELTGTVLFIGRVMDPTAG